MIDADDRPGQVEHLQRRARTLALEKSYLELVVRLMSRTTAATGGVEDVVETLLRNVLDVIGGTNISLYYVLDNTIHSVDVYGARAVHEQIEDPYVRQVFETRTPIEYEQAFAETRMVTPEFTKAYTWVYPLVAGADLVGVLRMEHLHIGMRDLYMHLPVFFTYAAQVLKNEVRNVDRLRQAFDELAAVNAALREENLARQRSEEELRRAKEGLETRVAERTREIGAANRQLQQELVERRRAETALTWRNQELGALNRFLRGAAGDLTPAELLDLACRELATALGLPHGLTWLLDEPVRAGAPPDADGAEAEPDEQRPRWAPAGFVQQLLVGQGPLVAEQVESDARLRDVALQFPGVTVASLIAVAVAVDEGALGCIVLVSDTPRTFSDQDVALVARIGEQASSALARLRAQADSRRLRVAIEQGPDSVVITDETGRILYVNPAFSTVTGYRRGEVVGQNPRKFKSGQHDATFYEQMWATLLAGGTWHGRLTNRKKNGDLFTEDAIIVPVRDNRGRVTNYIALKRDVTRELAREEHLRHAQRMESIGQLAGGIAHDFNNLLGVILMQLEMIQLEHELPPAVVEGIGEVRKASERAARLTRQLLTFGRRQTMSVRPHDLNEILRQHVTMLTRILRETIVLSFEPGAQQLPVSVDAAMIEQVVMNLCVNARDAMPGGGRVTLETGIAEFDERTVPANPDARPGRYAWLRVTDTGTGMTPEVLHHLFEPFFTTKDVGRGTGLGLATSYGIVSQHRGWIDVTSTLGTGSAFTVYLPWSGGAPRRMATAATRKLEGGHATILLVEDEAAIRRMTQRCLEQLGYHVIAASDGVEARGLWERSREEIDLLLTDVVMPNGLSGVELSQLLRQEKPDLRIVLMSGYPADIAREGGYIGPDVRFMPKPFTLVQLGQMVKQALAAGAATPPA